MSQDAIVVGAGVAGLRCAAGLGRAGRRVLVLERARSVGGRCATRRVEGQPVDLGPMFLHGHRPDFLGALAAVDAAPARPWPRTVVGGGMPCQPGALDPGRGRVAYAEGLRAFPRHLAQGLDVRLETEVVAARVVEGGFEVACADGERLRCRDLVLALALEETRRLLRTLQAPELAATQALLGMFASVPSLTLVAGYPLDAPAPAWDLCFPEASDILQLVARDSGKRPEPRFLTLVAQARPRWSRQRLEADRDAWAAELLEELASLAGPWARQPLWTHAHAWRHARLDSACELAEPVCVRFTQGQCLGLAGDLFAPGGGVQAAWWSGNRLAERMNGKESA